jgi:hypothetical protein
MKLGLQNYAIIIPIEKSCIKFDNNKFNGLESYDIVHNYRILDTVVLCLSQHNLIILQHRHIQKLR